MPFQEADLRRGGNWRKRQLLVLDLAFLLDSQGNGLGHPDRIGEIRDAFDHGIEQEDLGAR